MAGLSARVKMTRMEKMSDIKLSGMILTLFWSCSLIACIDSSRHTFTNSPQYSMSKILRLRGGSDAAAQLAEIRARRAREYEASKSKDMAVMTESSSLSPWSYVSAKINPSTIGTTSKKMAIGDARNYYLDHGATVFRNRKTGYLFQLDYSTLIFLIVPQ